MISTVIVAFSMFSAIPMPQTEWTNKSMRYALCAFPLIGAVIGALVCLWRFVCLRMEFSGGYWRREFVYFRCLCPEAFIWTASAIRQMRWQVIRIQKKNYRF